MKKILFIIFLLASISGFGQKISQIKGLQDTLSNKYTVGKTMHSPKINSSTQVLVTSEEMNTLINIRVDKTLKAILDSMNLEIKAKTYNANVDSGYWVNSAYVQNLTDSLAALKANIAYTDSIPYTPFTSKIVEQKARVADLDSISGGTVRMVGAGQTYATFTAAYTAASNGDTIRAIAGTYDMAAESGGYWLVNTATKGVIVCGVKGDSSAVIITQSSATYGVRIRDCHKMQFKDLTFSSNQNYANGTLSQESAYHSNYLKVENCALINTNTGSSARSFNRTSATGNTETVYTEFKNCHIIQAGTGSGLVYGTSGVNETMLINGCTFNSSGGTGILYNSSNKGTIAIYDSHIIQSGDFVGIQLGEDTSTPTNSTFKVDIRNTTVSYTGSHYSHGVLMGRGTDFVYFVNNDISMPAVSGGYGLVIKTVAASLGNAYFAGNRATAERPIYIKGGKNCILEYSTGISNHAGYGALNVTNPASDLLSSTNTIKFNNFIGLDEAIWNYSSGAWELPTTTMQGWTMDNNRYYSTSGIWAIKEDNSHHYLATKRTFWLKNFNDTYSKFVTSPTIIYDNNNFIIDNTTVN